MYDKPKGACRGNERRAQKMGKVIISFRVGIVQLSGLDLRSRLKYAVYLEMCGTSRQ